MTFHFMNALVLVALASSLLVVMQQGERLFPVVALIVTIVEALLAFGIMDLSLRAYRIDVILPAVLTLAGAICWSRAAAKGATTSATLVLFIGALQLLLAIGVLR